MIERKAVKHFDPEMNFWECGAELKAFPKFKELYNGDKSKNKSVSSNIMWYVYFVSDINSIAANQSIEERKEYFRLEYVDCLKDVDKVPNEELEELCDEYKKITETPAMRQMRIWELKMLEKTKLMEDTPYDLNTWEALDKMMKSNVEAYKSYSQIMEQLSKDDGSTHAKGGGERSLTDQGLI